MIFRPFIGSALLVRADRTRVFVRMAYRRFSARMQNGLGGILRAELRCSARWSETRYVPTRSPAALALRLIGKWPRNLSPPAEPFR